MKKNVLALLLTVVMLLCVLTGCGSAPHAAAKGSATTTEFEVIGRRTPTTETSGSASGASLTVTTDAGLDEYTLDLGSQTELADALYHYRADLRLRATYNARYELSEYSVIRTANGEDLGALTAEELFNAFDWRGMYETAELTYTGSLKLSLMKADVAYALDMGKHTGLLDIVNDTGKGMLVTVMDPDRNTRTQGYYPGTQIGELRYIPNLEAFGDRYLIRCEALPNRSVARHLGRSAVYCLSGTIPGESASLGVAQCIYNDTEKPQKLTTVDGQEYVIPAGELVGCDWSLFESFRCEAVK